MSTTLAVSIQVLTGRTSPTLRTIARQASASLQGWLKARGQTIYLDLQNHAPISHWPQFTSHPARARARPQEGQLAARI